MRQKFHRIATQWKRIADLEEENLRLRGKIELMETLCGYKLCPHIVNSAIVMQAAARGWRLRDDKRIFDKSIAICTRNCRMYLARRLFKIKCCAIVTIQTHIRGRLIRKLAVGKAVASMLRYKKEVVQLELLTLRLTSMV